MRAFIYMVTRAYRGAFAEFYLPIFPGRVNHVVNASINIRSDACRYRMNI